MVIKSERKKKKELNNFCLTKYFPLPFISDSYLCVKIGGRFERARQCVQESKVVKRLTIHSVPMPACCMLCFVSWDFLHQTSLLNSKIDHCLRCFKMFDSHHLEMNFIHVPISKCFEKRQRTNGPYVKKRD